jgi:hypothetical protein
MEESSVLLIDLHWFISTSQWWISPNNKPATRGHKLLNLIEGTRRCTVAGSDALDYSNTKAKPIHHFASSQTCDAEHSAVEILQDPLFFEREL